MIFFFILKMVYYVYSLESHEAILMRTHKIPSCERKSKRFPYYASWPGAVIHTHYLELALSRTYFHGSKDVRAIEVLLTFEVNKWVRLHLRQHSHFSFYLLFRMESTLGNIFFYRSQFFSFRVDPVLERSLHPGKKKEVTGVVLCKNSEKMIGRTHAPQASP